MIDVLSTLESRFMLESSKDRARAQEAYLRDLFPFLGVVKPKINEIAKEVIRLFPQKDEEFLFGIVKSLWKKKEREYHHAAIIIMRSFSKIFSQRAFELYEVMIRENSWWDSVDDVAANLIGPFVQKYPSFLSRMDEWISDPDMWIRRTALLFQLRYKAKTDEALLFSYCEKTLDEKEFFIRKAIGWVLREYSKTRPEAVRNFLIKHEGRLSTLSKKEASKYL